MLKTLAGCIVPPLDLRVGPTIDEVRDQLWNKSQKQDIAQPILGDGHVCK